MRSGRSDRKRHGHNGRSFRRKGPPPVLRVEKPRVSTNPRALMNWRVRREGGEVVAIEPDQRYEHVFDGGSDPYMAAIEFAAKQLREGK